MQLDEMLRSKSEELLQNKQKFEEELKKLEHNHKKEKENLQEDLRKKSIRLSETNVALTKAAAKIEELSELKQGYQQKARDLDRELKTIITELAANKDLVEKLGKENMTFLKTCH